MNNIREMTVTVANTHPYLTTPTQENHQLPDQSSTKTLLQADESGDRGSNLVATAEVGINLKGVSTMGGGQENKMRVRKILAGIRINRMGPMREILTGLLMKMTATTETWGTTKLWGETTTLIERMTRR